MRGTLQSVWRTRSQTATQSDTQGATKPATWSTSRPATQPDMKLATQSDTQGATEPATWSTSRPATRSDTRPASQSDTQGATKPATWSTSSQFRGPQPPSQPQGRTQTPPWSQLSAAPQPFSAFRQLVCACYFLVLPPAPPPPPHRPSLHGTISSHFLAEFSRKIMFIHFAAHLARTCLYSMKYCVNMFTVQNHGAPLAAGCVSGWMKLKRHPPFPLLWIPSSSQPVMCQAG